jgi:hypothetical protein
MPDPRSMAQRHTGTFSGIVSSNARGSISIAVSYPRAAHRDRWVSPHSKGRIQLNGWKIDSPVSKPAGVEYITEQPLINGGRPARQAATCELSAADREHLTSDDRQQLADRENPLFGHDERSYPTPALGLAPTSEYSGGCRHGPK